MRIKRQSNGQWLFLDPTLVIGAGGEARIYLVPEEKGIVAKIYHKPTPMQARKLAVMIANPPEDPMAPQGHIAIAWPLDLLLHGEDGRKVIGFLMPRITGMRPLIEFYNPRTRRRQTPLFNYLYLHRAARNLAAVVRALHARGYVIGDLNESNILMSETALVTIVDTDSFQVPDPERGTTYRCPVGKPEFTPPELQSQYFEEVDRTPEHDLFGLGVLLFKLLMEGTHPFDGLYEGSGEPPPYKARIAAGYFPYARWRRVPFRPPPSAPPFEILHPALRELFWRCFEKGHTNPSARPDAQTWLGALTQAEESLVTCVDNDQHWYGKHLSTCPWCERTQRLGWRDPFPSRQAVALGHHLLPDSSPPTPVLPPNPPLLPQPQSPPASPAPPPTLPPRLLTSAPASYPTPSLRTRHPLLLKYLRPILLILFLLAAALGGWYWWVSTPIASLSHSQAVNSVAFSPTGNLVVSGDEANTVRLWDLQTWSSRRLPIQHRYAIKVITFSPDGTLLASGGNDGFPEGSVKLWDAQSGELKATLNSHTNTVRALTFSPNGTLLASGGDDGTVKLWEVQRQQNRVIGKLKWTLEKHLDTIRSLAFSPDGALLASGGDDGRVILWNVSSGEPEQVLTTQQGGVLAVAFAPDGRSLAAGGSDGTIQMWVTSTWQLKRRLTGHTDYVRALAFTPDGQILASGSDDQTVILWDFRTGRLVRRLTRHDGWVYSLSFSPSGLLLTTGSDDGQLRLWRVK